MHHIAFEHGFVGGLAGGALGITVVLWVWVSRLRDLLVAQSKLLDAMGKQVDSQHAWLTAHHRQLDVHHDALWRRGLIEPIRVEPVPGEPGAYRKVPEHEYREMTADEFVTAVRRLDQKPRKEN